MGDGAMTTERKIRVLIAKPGLDGHDRGAPPGGPGGHRGDEGRRHE